MKDISWDGTTVCKFVTMKRVIGMIPDNKRIGVPVFNDRRQQAFFRRLPVITEGIEIFQILIKHCIMRFTGFADITDNNEWIHIVDGARIYTTSMPIESALNVMLSGN